MEQDHVAFMGTKENACDPASIQINPYFPKTSLTLDWAAKWHAYRPPEFRCSDIISDQFVVFRR